LGNEIEKVLAKILEIHNLYIKPWIIMILIMAVIVSVIIAFTQK
jgi:uncharacterized membrane protein (DUF106 family)